MLRQHRSLSLLSPLLLVLLGSQVQVEERKHGSRQISSCGCITSSGMLRVPEHTLNVPRAPHPKWMKFPGVGQQQTNFRLLMALENSKYLDTP